MKLKNAAMKLKDASPYRKSYDQPRQHIKKQRHYFANKGASSQSYGFSSSHYGCESWTIKKAEHWRIDAFETVVLEKTLKSPLDFKEIQPVHPKGNQSWVLIGRTDAEAETPNTLATWCEGKHPDAGNDLRQEEKRMTEDEMARWHYQLDGDEFV